MLRSPSLLSVFSPDHNSDQAPLVSDVRMSHAFEDRIHYEAIKKLSDEGRTDRCDIVSFQQIKLTDD